MRSKLLIIVTGLILTLTLGFRSADAQANPKVAAKEASLIAHLVKEVNHPDAHSAGDHYLLVSIGKVEYLAELKTGKIVSRSKTDSPSGGYSGAYAEVGVRIMNKDKEDTSQGAGQILKLTGGKWTRIALNESDYVCADVRSIPKSVLKALKVECN